MAEFKDVLFSNSMEIMAFRFFFSFFDQAKIEMEDVSFVRWWVILKEKTKREKNKGETGFMMRSLVGNNGSGDLKAPKGHSRMVTKRITLL